MIDDQPFILQEKIADMMKYGLKAVDKFSWRDRKLADQMKKSMFTMYRFCTAIKKRHYKKTTLSDLDIELDNLRFLTRLAQDEGFYDEKVPKRGRNGKVVKDGNGKTIMVNRSPPLNRKSYEVWNRMLDEIGRLIGGYIRSMKQ